MNTDVSSVGRIHLKLSGVKTNGYEPVQIYSISGGENCNGIGDCLGSLTDSNVLENGDNAFPDCVNRRCTGIVKRSLYKAAQADDASDDDVSEVNGISQDAALVNGWKQCVRDAQCRGPRHPTAICYKGWCIEDTFPTGYK